MAIKVIFLIIFFAVMILIGVMTRRKARSVDGFVLGGRSAGPWLMAFGYGTSYFSAVVFVGVYSGSRPVHETAAPGAKFVTATFQTIAPVGIE